MLQLFQVEKENKKVLLLLQGCTFTLCLDDNQAEENNFWYLTKIESKVDLSTNKTLWFDDLFNVNFKSLQEFVTIINEKPTLQVIKSNFQSSDRTERNNRRSSGFQSSEKRSNSFHRNDRSDQKSSGGFQNSQKRYGSFDKFKK